MSLLDKLVVLTLPLVPKTIVRGFASRYIAGESIEDALRVVEELNGQGCSATLDVLGEFITRREEAERAVQEYLAALDRIQQRQLDANISVKLTMLGLKLDVEFCLGNMKRLVTRAGENGSFVRIDMEDSSCTSDTLHVYNGLRKDFDNVGCVLQAYMRRSLSDIRHLKQVHQKINVRLCKGIYVEPRELAYKDMAIINSNYVRLLEELLTHQNYVGIATHDERLVWAADNLIDRLKLPKDKFEFQMLLGVEERLRKMIVADGFKLRVYVPYGRQWYEYSMRRFKENPRVAANVIKSVLSRK